MDKRTGSGLVVAKVVLSSLLYPFATLGNVGATHIEFTDAQFDNAASLELSTAVHIATDNEPIVYPEGTSYYEAQFRLIPGRLTLYDVTGDVNAYVYFGYFGPGSTPTIDDLVTKSISVYDKRRELIDSMERLGGDPKRYRDFYLENFPEYLYSNFVIYGVNLDDAAYYSQRSRIPHIILQRKFAEDLARDHLGGADVSLVRYIWGSRVNGYEFTDGTVNVVVPFDMDGLYLTGGPILTREEIEKSPELFQKRSVHEDMRIGCIVYWHRMLEALEVGSFDLDEE